MRGPRAPVGHRESGFALMIVLWVLAGLTVIAVVVASSARVSNQNVKLLRDRVRAEVAFIGTSARIKVVAATAIPSSLSLEGPKGRLLVDGRTGTTGEAGEQVAIQDGRGLIDLNRVNPERLHALLVYCGAEDAAATTLVDTLGDYVDSDQAKRLNGAEAPEYRAAGLVEPRNAKLLSREELWRIKGWSALRGTWLSRGCDDLVTVHGDGRFNRNTASPGLLQVAGFTADAATAMVEARREGFAAQTTPASVLGGDFSTAFGSSTAGTSMRVSHMMESFDGILVYDLQLTPTRSGGPWRVHEIRYRPRPATRAVATFAMPAPDFEQRSDQRPTTNAPFSTPAPN